MAKTPRTRRTPSDPNTTTPAPTPDDSAPATPPDAAAKAAPTRRAPPRAGQPVSPPPLESASTPVSRRLGEASLPSTNEPADRKTTVKTTARTATKKAATTTKSAPNKDATPKAPRETAPRAKAPRTSLTSPPTSSLAAAVAAAAPPLPPAATAEARPAGADVPASGESRHATVSAPARRERKTRDAGSRRILMVASEAVPFAKTGGLADVVAALPKALGKLGHQVTVALPRYRAIAVYGAPTAAFDVEMGGHHYHADVYVQELSPGMRVALVDHPAFFDRDALYGIGSQDYGDNPRRFAFLSLAALEFARLEGEPVDIVHAHDWQAGLTPVYLRTRYAEDPVLGDAATVFTIHNIAYQGLCSADWLPQLGLGWDVFTVDSLEFWLHASFLKGGIMFSDIVTTVSRRYAQELLTPAFSFGFEGILRHRQSDLVGILNGIDDELWNPATDKHLPRPYSAEDLAGKAEAKRVLLDTFGLPGGDDVLRRPVVAMISRMVDQKGLDLIAAVSEQLPQLGAAFTILGTGEPWYEEMWRSLARRYPDRVGVRIGFDEPLSHVIEAGADVFMMPSRFEPCGLNQMYSLRYGTIPVVRATGGLDDTVRNYDPVTGEGTGFSFHELSGEALLGTLRWALHVFHNDPERWHRLQQSGMARDFSWTASARAYLEAYSRASGQVTARQRASARAV